MNTDKMERIGIIIAFIIMGVVLICSRYMDILKLSFIVLWIMLAFMTLGFILNKISRLYLKNFNIKNPLRKQEFVKDLVDNYPQENKTVYYIFFAQMMFTAFVLGLFGSLVELRIENLIKTFYKI